MTGTGKVRELIISHTVKSTDMLKVKLSDLWESMTCMAVKEEPSRSFVFGYKMAFALANRRMERISEIRARGFLNLLEVLDGIAMGEIEEID